MSDADLMSVTHTRSLHDAWIVADWQLWPKQEQKAIDHPDKGLVDGVEDCQTLIRLPGSGLEFQLDRNILQFHWWQNCKYDFHWWIKNHHHCPPLSYRWRLHNWKILRPTSKRLASRWFHLQTSWLVTYLEQETKSWEPVPDAFLSSSDWTFTIRRTDIEARHRFRKRQEIHPWDLEGIRLTGKRFRCPFHKYTLPIKLQVFMAQHIVEYLGQ